MALPLLLGLLGSGLASSGALGTFLGGNALLAGALGTGLGRTIESGDLGEGIKAGLGSYVGGSVLGSLAGGMGGNMAAKASGIPGTAPSGLSPGAITGTNIPIPPPRPDMLSAAGPNLMSAGKNAIAQMGDPQFLGSQLGASLASPPKMQAVARERGPDLGIYRPGSTQMYGAPEGYRPGYDPEFDYRTGVYRPRGMAEGGTVRKTVPGYGVVMMQAGGIADLVADRETSIEPDDGGFEIETERSAGPNEKDVIVEAVKAIKGVSEDPRVALGAFLAQYGEDALRDLVDRVQSGEFDETLERFRNGENGVVRGPGDGSGTDDKVPATIDGEQDVLLSDGEFVLRKDATDALEDEFGDGFMDKMNDAGPRAPEAVRQMVA